MNVAKTGRLGVPALLALFAGTALGSPGMAESGCADQPGHRHDHATGNCGKAEMFKRLHAEGRNPDGSFGRVLGIFGPDNGDDDWATREASSATDLQHCKLEIELVPSSATKNIIGKNTMTVRSTGNGLTQFTFRLRSQYTITALKVDGVNATASTPGANSYGRTITLPRTYNAGEVMTIEISYEGLAVSRGFGSIEFTTLGGSSAVFTLSEPYYAGTWWPVKDGDVFQPGDNSDKFTAEIWVTTPSAMTVASNGLLQGTDALTGSRKRSRWQTNHPIAPYLVSIGAATYNTWTSTYTPASGGSMPCQFFLSPGSDSTAQRNAWNQCIPMMETFRTMGGQGGYGLYPFFNEKYGIYEFTFGGGMEHQTMTGQFASTSESLTAHELGHQWWGDNVTCETWGDIWLNEGFATYSECLWQQYKTGSANNTAYFNAINARNPGSGAGSVYKFDTSDPGVIFDGTTSYNKGAWVLHMLRHVVGDTKFWQILQAHRAAHQGSAATTDEFFNVASATAGVDLNYFKNEWVYGTGSPTYQYGWQTVNINGQNYLRLYINQTQSASFGLYTMPIDVRVNNSFTGVVFNNADPEHFLIPIPAAATSVTLDHEGWILNGGKTQVAYVNGPAKIVQAVPALGSSQDASPGLTQVKVTFSENVTAAAADFTLTRDGSPVPFTLSYSAANFTATLDAGAPLAAGAYVVTVKDTVRTAAASIRLDGEIADPDNPASLPSGEGLALGNGVYNFTVTGVDCPADFNGDGFLSGDDFDGYVAAFESGDPSADFNGDGFISGDDFDAFVLAFETGC